MCFLNQFFTWILQVNTFLNYFVYIFDQSFILLIRLSNFVRHLQTMTVSLKFTKHHAPPSNNLTLFQKALPLPTVALMTFSQLAFSGCVLTLEASLWRAVFALPTASSSLCSWASFACVGESVKACSGKSFLLSTLGCWDLPACVFYESVYVIRWLTVKSGLPLVETVITYNNNTNITKRRGVKQQFKVNAAMCPEICNNYLKECFSFNLFLFFLYLMTFCCWLFVWETTSM